MKKKIEKLTPEQESRFIEFRDKWLKIGLCTEPANRPLAEDALIRSYKLAGLTPPKQIIWTTSPLAGALVVHFLKDEKFMKELFKKIKADAKPTKLGDGVRASVRDSVWASVGDSVRDSVWASVGDGVGDGVWASVGDSVRDSVWASVRASVRDGVGASVRASVGASVWASVDQAIWGQQEAGWLAFYDYFREVCDLAKETEKLIGLTDLAKHSNWIYPYKNIAVISEKPELVKLKNGAIHNESGPAVKYRDGFSVYGVEGRRMPEWIVETPASELDVKKIMALPNAEQRLYAIKKVGAGNMLKELKGKSISKKNDEYELFEVTIEGSKEKLLKMQNPSINHIHWEFVEPSIKTVNEALMWRLGLNVKTFRAPVAKT